MGTWAVWFNCDSPPKKHLKKRITAKLFMLGEYTFNYLQRFPISSVILNEYR